MEIKTVDELRKRYPDLVGQAEQTAADRPGRRSGSASGTLRT